MKTCTRCKAEQPLSNFYGQVQRSEVSDVSWTYKDSMCKKCRGDYTAERRITQKKEAVDYLGGKCLDCGLKDEVVAVYDFHHLDPTKKDFSLGKAKTLSFAKIKPELDKCVLLCANCHRRRHSSGL